MERLNTMARTIGRLAAVCVGLLVLAQAAVAQPCKREDFASTVDSAGAALRAFNSENGPKVMARLKELQNKRGWSEAEFEAKAIEYLHDPRVAALDQKANELLQRLDTLGEVDDRSPLDCKRLPQLEITSQELLAVMREKAALTMERINAALDTPARADAAPKATPPAAPSAAPQATKPAPRETANAEPAPQRPAAGSWNAATRKAPETARETQRDAAKDPANAKPPEASPSARDDSYRPPAAGGAAVVAAAPDIAGASPKDVLGPAPGSEDGFTIDEIRAATRGFFGTISTNLGSVIEYAFSNYGRPSGYVLGAEGGGAFLAGVRYGKGDLFMRKGDKRKVYWHGPSLGYDFGAEGSRTLFLIYRMKDVDELFRSFGGVDGSAYVIGGVGLTLLKGGPVLMTPIRTGVGLRLGANIGYVRFTPNATWNPF